MGEFIQAFAVMAIPVLLAITLHEAAHGYVANYFGDPTAKSRGRLSLNPIRHIDPFGTVILPLLLLFVSNFSFMFGYAKPVPVDTRNLRNPKTDMIWVALAGPAANVFLALMGGILLMLLPIVPSSIVGWFFQNLQFLILFNFVIALFNLLPIPPLDGGRIVAGLLPHRLSWKYSKVEPYGIVILVAVIFLLPQLGSIIGINMDLGRLLVFDPAYSLYDVVTKIFLPANG